jgi:hypothetical protein
MRNPIQSSHSLLGALLGAALCCHGTPTPVADSSVSKLLWEAAHNAVFESHNLGGEAIELPSIPTRDDWSNGFFKVDGILFPARDTLSFSTRQLTANADYTAWPQDKCFVFDKQVYLLFNEGTHHTAADVRPYWMKSVDGGVSWSEPELIFDPVALLGINESSIGVSVWGGGSTGSGRLCLTVRAEDALGKRQHWLIHRRLPQVRLPGENAIEVQRGSNRVIIHLSRHGLMPGDRLEIIRAGPLIAGLQVSREYEVDHVLDSGRFVILARNAPAATADLRGGAKETRITILPGKWRAVQIPIVVSPGESPTLFHSFAEYAPEAIAFGYHGKGSNGIAFTADFGRSWKTSSFHSYGVEPSLAVLDDRTVIGFLRTQSTAPDRPAQLFVSDDALQSFKVFPAPFPSAYSPIPVRVHKDIIYAFATERFGATQTTVHEPRMFLLRARVADFRRLIEAGMSPWEAFEVIQVGTLYFADLMATKTTSGTGAGSLAAMGDTLFIFYGSEDVVGSVNLYLTRLYLDDYEPVQEFFDFTGTGQPQSSFIRKP